MHKNKKRRAKLTNHPSTLKRRIKEMNDSESSDDDIPVLETETHTKTLITEKPSELLQDDCDSDSPTEDESSNALEHLEVCSSSQFDSYFDQTLGKIEDLQEKYQNRVTLSWESLFKIIYMNRAKHPDELSWFSNFKPFQNPDNPQAMSALSVEKYLAKNWFELNKNSEVFTACQREIFTVFQHYVSLLYPCYNNKVTVTELRQTFCLHALNHVLQSRARVLKNNLKLSKMSLEQRDQAECRDQGITRPKVLILVPFRDMAYQIVNTMLTLLERDTKGEVSFKKRFKEEFGTTESDISEDKINLRKKPEDYQALFSGNTDECFRIGIAFLRNSVRLYSPFYASDIIIASPLGMRTIIGEKGESHYEYDFLSSIEVLILDHADIFLMQNWEHVLHIIKHLHLQPKESHGVDFFRVRNLALDGQAKYFCQIIALASISSPLLNSLLTKYCFNHRGLAVVKEITNIGSICSITKSLPQIFHKLDVSSASFLDVQNIRFQFFINTVFKECKEKKMSRVLVYVPQYFDFVRLRNHMRREKKSASGPNFGYISEYAKATEVGKARRRFLTEKFPIMLYSERYHFYHRPHIRGIKHLIFYELPTYPHFYSEICNMINTSQDDLSVSSTSVITLYSKYDIMKFVSVLGDKRGEELLISNKNVHLFMTGSQT